MAEVMSPTASPTITIDRDRDRPLSSSRPLSEISENADRRRSTARESTKSNGTNGKAERSRPSSEVREEREAKRLSVGSLLPIHTITLNLNDYASNAAKKDASATSAIPSISPPVLAPALKNDVPAGLTERTGSMSSIKEAIEVDKGIAAKDPKEGADGQSEASPSDASTLLQAKRASLRPSPLGISYADIIKPTPSPAQMPSPLLSIPPSSAKTSMESSTSSVDLYSGPPKPPSKATKPSWLRRASGTAALNGLRSKSKSPVQREDGTGGMTASSSLPPVLPPRRNGGLEPAPTRGSLYAEEGGDMLPPELPSKSSYATIVAGSSRSRLADGQGRVAYSPAPPKLPSREGSGNIRGRLAAWTQAAQGNSSSGGGGGSSSFSRSESSASISTIASSSTFAQAQQRLPSSARQVLGTAGSAVQKGWAGLRARGVGGSISSMSALNVSSGGKRAPVETSGSWASGLASKSTRPADSGMAKSQKPAEGPVFITGVILRAGGSSSGRVFGRDLTEAGRTWGVIDFDEGNEMEKRRRQCLPALVVRSVDYLEIWGPKEEGIFRISGRSSHIARLRKEFDSGADLDLKECHPGDLDPHAVAGLFKSYLRELPTPLITPEMTAKIEASARKRQDNSTSGSANETHEATCQDLNELLYQLPVANWFLLADIVKLLDLIPRHTATNRMTLNALMLSLGPSLNIAGGVLSELLARRNDLFSKPPPRIRADVSDMIDFGNTHISPPALHSTEVDSTSRSMTPASQYFDENNSSNAKQRKIPKLPSKPSLTRLFSAATASASGGKASPNQDKEHQFKSIVDQEPPRVDLVVEETTPLPTFSSTIPSSQPPVLDDADPSRSSTGSFGQAHISESKKVEEVHYAKGTVSERARAFLATPITSTSGITTATATATATPIADRFQGTSKAFPALRSQGSFGSLRPTPSLPSLLDPSDSPPMNNTNPATVVRRGGQSVFFSSSAGVDRSSRSGSASATPSLRSEVTKRSSAQSLGSGIRSSVDGAKRSSEVQGMEMIV